MIITKELNILENEYDFTDSIVTKIDWDNNLLDLLIKIDYYWDIQEGNSESKVLIIRLKNCLNATFNMPSTFKNIPSEQIKDYINSWYTITDFSIIKNKDNLSVSIKTIDNNPKWLTLECEEIYLETE
jgi:hypothetical protein